MQLIIFAFLASWAFTIVYTFALCRAAGRPLPTERRTFKSTPRRCCTRPGALIRLNPFLVML